MRKPKQWYVAEPVYIGTDVNGKLIGIIKPIGNQISKWDKTNRR